ncbi:hypothetical protein [Paraburkholderia humisilvae]|uniref:Mercuric reductase n=1 Tax=Paraburkholderia humisilvae TaxID=627669 RepID=A0A6J5E9E8_9BURK|nr:hypothetical protein [Paraburkholderia humisilvae]CAB3763128.1 hypothetical protein LMG29542_04508 [Paraburkholderia humisilvae]
MQQEKVEIDLKDWFDAETHEAAAEMMQSDAVVPFGTAMWPF